MKHGQLRMLRDVWTRRMHSIASQEKEVRTGSFEPRCLDLGVFNEGEVCRGSLACPSCMSEEP